MKKILLALFVVSILAVSTPILAVSTPVLTENGINNSTVTGVTLRRNQFLKSNDGREIYLYTNGTCKMYDDGRFVASCTWEWESREIHLYADGEELYKGSFTMSSNGIDIASLRLAGTIYYNTGRH